MVFKQTLVANKSAGGATRNILRSGGKYDSWNSLEQFVTPIQIQKNHPAAATLPGFRKPDVSDEDGVFGPEGAVGPTIHNLDPYFPLDNLEDGDDGSKFFEKNDFVSVYSNAKSASGGPQLDLTAFTIADGGDKKTIHTVRINALRGPLILSGWGYGSDDMPVPNKGHLWPDNQSFSPDTPNDRTKWKTGPVHLMWDDERQVWHGGPRVVCGVVVGGITKGDICNPSSFLVKLLRNTKNIAKGGDLTDDTEETIEVKNRDPSLEQAEIENQIFCMAIKINYEWLPLWVGCPDTPACGLAGQPDPPECIESDC
jgi:hypothetical protein